MSYTPFNESLHVIRGNSNQDGIDITPVSQLLQGNEIRDPLRLRKGLLPYMGMRSIRVDEHGLIDKSIEINDLGQDVKSSTTAYVDTTERWTPAQIIQGDLAESFLSELVTQQAIDEKNDGEVSIFEPDGVEVPFTARGTKSSVFSADSYRGWQPLDTKYQFLESQSEFLDGQEEILGIAVPQILSNNFDINLAFNDNNVDQTDRYGINILNQGVDLYNRYASSGFVYENNVRDSIAFGGLKG
jgi:hypothetical protein